VSSEIFERIKEKLGALSDDRVDYLLDLGMESEDIDYKEDLDINNTESVVKIAKDIAAIANVGGGYIVLGIDKDFKKKGLPPSRRIDEAVLRDKINKYFDPPIEIYYREVSRKVDGEIKKFGVIYVAPSKEIVIVRRSGNYSKKGKTVTEFREGEILIRDGSKSKPAGLHELRKLLDAQIAKQSAETLQKAETIANYLRKRAEADDVREKLSSNLFKVEKLPEIIWCAPTEFTEKKSVYEYYKEREIKDSPPFILKEKKIFTFSDLTIQENVLREIIDEKSVLTERASEWLTDNIKRRYLIELLNVTIKDDFCKRIGLIFDNKRKRYYFALLPGLESRKFSWSKKGKSYNRTVVKYDKRNSLYIHDAARIKFGFVGDLVCLTVDPCFVITYDGKTLATDDKSKELYTKLASEYYNKKYLTDLEFWVHLLKGRKSVITITGLGYQIQLSTRPFSCSINVGIKGDR
jgi:hypothetical protein